jgi:hypothetical protein
MHDLMEALVPIAFFTAIGIVFARYFQYRHQENMAMIERGMTTAPKKAEKRRRSTTYFMYGMLFLFVGIAFVSGLLIREYYSIDDAIIPALMLIGAGLAMMATYGIAHDEEHKRGEHSAAEYAAAKEHTPKA